MDDSVAVVVVVAERSVGGSALGVVVAEGSVERLEPVAAVDPFSAGQPGLQSLDLVHSSSAECSGTVVVKEEPRIVAETAWLH